jgi:hypothetical protein
MSPATIRLLQPKAASRYLHMCCQYPLLDFSDYFRQSSHVPIPAESLVWRALRSPSDGQHGLFISSIITEECNRHVIARNQPNLCPERTPFLTPPIEPLPYPLDPALTGVCREVRCVAGLVDKPGRTRGLNRLGPPGKWPASLALPTCRERLHLRIVLRVCVSA